MAKQDKPKAALVVLVRERELHELLGTIAHVQHVFNDNRSNGYDYVILSETAFSDHFKKHIKSYLQARPSTPRVRFGLIEQSDWAIPKHIDMEKAERAWKKMSMSGLIPYGGSKIYRQMCRYMSYNIFRHPLVMEYDFYWRLEPGTQHLCRLDIDPFRYMRDHGKKYAWVLSIKEYRSTVRTLMVHVNRWREKNRDLIPSRNSLGFISDDGVGFNLCHWWSNFEIADLSFFRSEAYRTLYETLDKAGGFFYERWGDAPVHSIAAALLLRPDEIWKVEDAGYTHPPYTHCPRTNRSEERCACDPQVSFEYDPGAVNCENKWDEIQGINTTDVISRINNANGEIEAFKEGDRHYVIKPERLIHRKR